MEPTSSETPAAPTVSERQGYIGGSDAAAILGLSPYSTPFSVFVQKMGGATRPIDDALQEKFDFGHDMEPVIANAFARRYRFDVFKPSKQTEFLRNVTHPFMGGHIDYWVKRYDDEYPFAIAECKNIEFRGPEWGDPDPEGRNANNIAIYYLTQCDHYMALTGVEYCYLLALFGGCRLVPYLIKRDLDREAILLEAEDRFWRRVQADDPPDFGGSLDDLTLALRTKYLKGVTAAEAKKEKMVLQLSDATAKLLSEIKAHRRVLSREKKEEQAKVGALIRLLEGKTGYLQIGGEKWGSLLMQDRHYFDDFEFKMKHPDLYAQFESERRIGPILRLRKDADEESNDTEE